jgi:hypothetical protein
MELINQVLADKERYQRLEGRLIYLFHTRLNIIYDFSVVSHCMHNLGEVHMNVIIRILWYFKSAPRKCLMFCKYNKATIVGYCDLDWYSKEEIQCLTIGYFIFIKGNLVT